MKKTLICMLVFVLMFTNLSSVLANPISAPPANQISADLDFAEVEWTLSSEKETQTRGVPNIVFLKSSISKSSSTSVTISAKTETDIVCVFVGGQMTIQRWINNSWTNYQSYTFWSYNSARASSTRTVTVPSGYYYRLVVAHMASSADGSVGKQSTTTSIFVN